MNFNLTKLGLVAIATLTFHTALTSKAHANEQATQTRYGLVRSITGTTLQIQGLNGQTQSYPLPPSDSRQFVPGDLVSYDMATDGTVSRVQPPATQRVFEGNITRIDGERVTLVSGTGEQLTTTVPARTIEHHSLAPGKGLVVTQYQGTWATKVCCPPVAALPSTTTTPLAPPPAYDGGGELLPIPALW